jgi:hypothetical protein
VWAVCEAKKGENIYFEAVFVAQILDTNINIIARERRYR